MAGAAALADCASPCACPPLAASLPGPGSDSGKYSNGSINSDCTCASHGYVADLANGKGATVQRGCVAGSYMNETCGKACRTW